MRKPPPRDPVYGGSRARWQHPAPKGDHPFREGGAAARQTAERMRDLENVALGFGGIEKAYAISASRAVCVFVKPIDLDDLGSIKLARDIANKIESTMQFLAPSR